jgi:hypothetical protein
MSRTVMTFTIKTRKNCFRYIRLMSPLNAAICTTISYTLWVEWYYLKNKYLTLRSKVKVPWRSLRYATYRLMVMHPLTNYHWPISKDKNVMVAALRRDISLMYLKQFFLVLIVFYISLICMKNINACLFVYNTCISYF